MQFEPKYLVGIDEVGRGPLAGPVAVGVVKIPTDFDWNLLPGVDDSKKLTSEKRSEIFNQAKKLRHTGHLDFTVAQVGPSVIDQRGIVHAIKLATNRCISRLGLRPEQVTLRLDGSLYAPLEFKQATIIKGDTLYAEIGLASIVAKVTRDTYMCRIARRFSRYGFEGHKGYGTKAHRDAIRRYGLSPIHRVSYCQNCL
jgi:ribonuclease HII